MEKAAIKTVKATSMKVNPSAVCMMVGANGRNSIVITIGMRGNRSTLRSTAMEHSGTILNFSTQVSLNLVREMV